jgi:hypothetical protein
MRDAGEPAADHAQAKAHRHGEVLPVGLADTFRVILE